MPAAAAFVPAVALGYEYGDADVADHLPRRVAPAPAGEMDFFKKEKRERKDAAAAAAFVPSSDDGHLGIKEDELTINVITLLICFRIIISIQFHFAFPRPFPSLSPVGSAGRFSLTRWI